MIEKDPDQTSCASGYTAYLVRNPGGVYADQNFMELVGIRHGRLYFVALSGGGTVEPSPSYGQQSRIFVENGSPIDPAVFTLVLPPQVAPPAKAGRKTGGTWGFQTGGGWVENQNLPRRLLLEETALYEQFAQAFAPDDAAALLDQINVSQIVYEDHEQTCFVVNADARKISDRGPATVHGWYFDDDGTRVDLVLVLSLAGGRLQSAYRRRIDGRGLTYVIPTKVVVDENR